MECGFAVVEAKAVDVVHDEGARGTTEAEDLVMEEARDGSTGMVNRTGGIAVGSKVADVPFPLGKAGKRKGDILNPVRPKVCSAERCAMIGDSKGRGGEGG